MSNDTATLNDLIEVLTDGQTFYQEAAGKVKRADLKMLFARMALNKAAIATDHQLRCRCTVHPHPVQVDVAPVLHDGEQRGAAGLPVRQLRPRQFR